MTALQKRAVAPFMGLFSDLFDPYDYAVPGRWQSNTADVQETEAAFILTCDAPGVDPKEIQVRVDGDVLRVKAERKTSSGFVSYSQTFRLPKRAAHNEIDAVYERGVLTVTVPKAEDAKARNIEVRVRD